MRDRSSSALGKGSRERRGAAHEGLLGAETRDEAPFTPAALSAPGSSAAVASLCARSPHRVEGASPMESEAEPSPPGGPDATATLLSAADAPPPAEAPPPAAPELPPSAHVAPPARPPSMVFLSIVTVISLAADLVTKGLAKGHLTGFDAKLKGIRKLTVIKDHFDLIFAQNPGGAWSFLRGLPDTLRRPFFLVVSAAA